MEAASSVGQSVGIGALLQLADVPRGLIEASPLDQ
jgi:hypothetical protein